ncbi:DUF2868 domain-containing protein [Parahaliea maris]|uniref:DUF2868 domain-containing protein n=1 Tax=Parahaliea maris TaxID=2716870 RepID=A0A5C8ZWP2_9GAMM|nr:DUF2868 domain-containing protein [Parahaliea maris]TXS92868.1 DUF2868 domain-containing protein [Parahaliea maris]
MPQRPDLADLYRLSGQLEADAQVPLAELKQRDHGIGRDCSGGSHTERLLYWLDHVAPVAEDSGRYSGAMGANLSRLLALVLGFVAMAGFLLGSGKGLVNVFLLLLVFVVLQLIMSVLSTVALVRTVSGFVPAGLPASPARWFVLRSLPDQRSLREAGGVLRLLFLRFGQEWGALFTLAALVAFVAVPAFKDFVFVWGSTYAPGDGAVQGLVDTLAAPWRDWLPWATVPPEVVAGSRHHDALVLDRAGIDGMRGWWPFLLLCLLVYALLPRLLLWGLARWYGPKLMRRAFAGLPGADRVLARMDAALVSTQAPEVGEESATPVATPAVEPPVPVPEGLLLIDWAGALGSDLPGQFEELPSVPADAVLTLGQAGLEQDRQALAALDSEHYEHLLVLVKSWEPPVGELADMLALLPAALRCSICLVPLPGRSIPHRKVEDWRGFARELPFAGVDVRILNRVAPV